MSIIHYADLRAGAGKSYASAAIAVKRHAVGKKTMIVVPTIKLGREIQTVIKSIDPSTRLKAYHSEEYNEGSGGCVLRSVLENLAENNRQGEIIVLCRQTFARLPYINRKSRWEVFIDEGVPVFENPVIGLQECFALVTNCLSVTEADARYGRVEVIDRTRLRRIADNKGKDRLWAELSEIASLLLNNNYKH